MNYSGLESKLIDAKPKAEDIPDALKAVIAESDQDNLAVLYRNNPEYHHIPAFMGLLTMRKNELKSKNNATNGQPA